MMAEKKAEDRYDENDHEPVKLGYEGSQVSTVMRWVYLIFLIWGVYYVVRFGVPSLKEWLTNPPSSLF